MSSAPVEGDTRGRDLGLWPIVGLIVGSMIGAGIFNLPMQIAGVAASGPMLIGWAVFGLGMVFLAFTFQNLGRVAPHVDGGVYGFAKDGFGDYMGFSTSWGYWLSTWTGSVSYLVLLFSSLGLYFPAFKGGNTPAAILGASIFLWLVHGLILSGIKEATFINMIVTAAKVIPLLVFVVLGITAFKVGLFTTDFWGATTQVPADGGTAPLGSPTAQVNGMMVLLVWYFLGIESASIYAARARRRKDSATATIIGFLVVLSLLVGINILAFGITDRAALAGYEDPSLAGVLTDVVGPWGAHFVTIGIVLSLVGGYMSWMLLSSEILMYPGKDGNLPTWFGTENRKGVPVAGLWLTSACMQLMLLWTLVNDSTYTQLMIAAGAMVLLPYLWSALYQVVIAVRRRQGYADGALATHRVRDAVIGAVAAVFACYLLYVSGLDYVYLAGIAITLGTILFVIGRHQRGRQVFKPYEAAIFVVWVLLAIFAIYRLSSGAFTL